MNRYSVLITGCSDGSLGSALALELNRRGCRVIATGRNDAKLRDVQAAGVETVILDVLSTQAIKASVSEVTKLLEGGLDMLINNVGGVLFAPVIELDIDEARRVFDLNVWSHIAMCQAYMPLLLKSKPGGIIVNHTSGASVISTPFMSLYGASKASLAMFTRGLDTELTAFGIRAVDLKSGSTHSNIYVNSAASYDNKIPRESLFFAAKDWLDTYLSGAPLQEKSMSRERWASEVATALLRPKVRRVIWVGPFSWSIWLGSYLPYSVQDMIGRGIARCSHIDACIQEYGTHKAIDDAYHHVNQ